MKHEELVKLLVKSKDQIHGEITADCAGLIHMVMGISGESGELLDAVKKHVIYRKPLDMANVIEELGDLEFYLEGFRQELGVSREECLQGNVKKLLKRYDGAVYTDAAAIQRADKN